MEENVVRIFDTTLRDGEQAPGNAMTPEEKLRLARQLDALGVDVIEAGFPAASDGDFRGVRAVAEEVRRPALAALARCHDRDIDLAGEALAPAARPRIHVFIATSDIHLKYKLRIDRDECLERACAAIRRARRFTDDVEFSAEDASRTELDFLCRVIGAAIAEGATTINLPDTVGYALPVEYGAMFRAVRERVPGARGGRDAGRMHRERHRRARGQRLARGGRDGGARPTPVRLIPYQRQYAGDLPHEPVAVAPHGRLPSAQQGRGRPQRVCARGGHPPARRDAERPDLRDHAPGGGRHPALDARAREAFRPPRPGAALPRAGLRPRRADAGGAVPGVHGARRP